MIRFLVNTAIFLGSAALGLWVTSLIVDGFTVNWEGLVIAVVIFTVAQAILSPFILKMTNRYAQAFLGGVGLVSTFVALLLTTIFSDGLTIDGATAWVIGTLLVWLITALATWLLPLFLLKKAVEERRNGNGAGPRRP